jgi:hypothetical protein
MKVSCSKEDVAAQMRKPEVNYSKKIAEEILYRISSGETVLAIANDDHMPRRATIYEWLDSKPEFATKFHAATKIRGRVWLEQHTDKFLNGETEMQDFEGRIVNLSARVTQTDKAGSWLRWYVDKVDKLHSISDDIIPKFEFKSTDASEQINEIVALVANGVLTLSQGDKLTAMLCRSVELTEFKRVKEKLEEQIRVNESRNALGNLSSGVVSVSTTTS